MYMYIIINAYTYIRIIYIHINIYKYIYIHIYIYIYIYIIINICSFFLGFVLCHSIMYIESCISTNKQCGSDYNITCSNCRYF